MSTPPLMAGLSPETSQWRARTLQMANWGGFHGLHTITFDARSTLVTGGSGTGKSTLLDAYTALMMPPQVPFNGASNDATTGRARGRDQRNVLTYVRGKQDSARDGEDLTDKVLRGDGEPTWSALAITFENDLRGVFTVARTYYAPTTARSQGEVHSRMFTLEGTLDLKELEQAAADKFAPQQVRKIIPEIKHHEHQDGFRQTVATALGIGKKGDGSERPLRLLARIQAGRQVKTVDGLYKDLVLDPPRTYEAAEETLKHFQKLRDSYDSMQAEGARAAALEGITENHDRLVDLHRQADQIDRVKPAAAHRGNSPFDLWQARTALTHLERWVREVEEETEQAEADLVNHGDTVTRLDDDLQQIAEDQRRNGGEALERLTTQIAQAEAALAKVQHARDILAARTTALGVALDDEQTFEEARRTAREFLDDVHDTLETLKRERDQARAPLHTLEAKQQDLHSERQSLEHRNGRIPQPHHEARVKIAHACGLTVEDLPFAGELMDLSSDHQDWRLAAEMTLRGVGLTMLMDERRQQHIRRTIDDLDLPMRITFDGATPGQAAPDPADTDFISGRLVFADHPFTGWVKDRVQQRGTDHQCVHSPADLGGATPKVTLRGQTSHGKRGAHGRNRNQQFVLGFSNTDRLEEIDQEITRLDQEITRRNQRADDLEARSNQVRSRKEAHQAVLDARWEDHDLGAAQAHHADLQAQRQRLLQDDTLAELARQHQATKDALEEARRAYFRCAQKVEDSQQRHADLTKAHDQRTAARAALEGKVTLTDDDTRYLDEQIAEHGEKFVSIGGFETTTNSLRNALARRVVDLREQATDVQTLLETTFSNYNQQWPDPNRGSTVAEYPEFKAIYDKIHYHGLPERQAEWRQEMQTQSTRDLMSLYEAFTQAHEEIDDRLDPVNEVLAGLAFGPRDGRLRIDKRARIPKRVEDFRRAMRALFDHDTVEWTEEQAMDRFHQLNTLMGQIDPEVADTASRDELLDVRKHVHITATEVDADGREVSTYAALGGKSGGESQELVAFITGAALRYQLGDETRTVPRFAPVVLDEGFVKADDQFASRAVNAWQVLGFQLVIATPVDKFTGLEPYMASAWTVQKSLDTGYSFLVPITQDEGDRQ